MKLKVHKLKCKYHSLAKECPWVERFSYKSKKEEGGGEGGGGGTLLVLPYLTKKEHPCHVYNDSKQIIGKTITYSGVTSDFEVKS